MALSYEDGQTIGETTLDAIAKASECSEDPELLFVQVVLILRERDGRVHSVYQSWCHDDPG